MNDSINQNKCFDGEPMTRVVHINPPKDVLGSVFSPTTRQSWRRNSTEELEFRLDVLGASGPYPCDPSRAYRLRCLRAQKAAWETYVFTAFACGMFEGDKGKDLYGRFRGADAAGFRSAMSECEVCWFLAARMRLPLNPNAPGRNEKNLELHVFVDRSEVGVEVKAPLTELPLKGISYGDDSDKIAEAMNNANKKFDEARPNLLVLTPRLRRQLYTWRRDLLKAAFGESMITWPVNVQTGESGPVEMKFSPNGKFLNVHLSGGKNLKPDGLPANRRISAVLVIEEVLKERYPFPNPLALLDEETRTQILPHWEGERVLHLSDRNIVWMDHNVLLVHNPYAYHALPQNTFVQYPQLVPVGDHMRWTDGAEIFV